ncbi:MAG: hypothetical protein U0325_32335 [Polyangiales bacterium]
MRPSREAAAPPPGDHVPSIAGGDARVFAPPDRRALNDHSLVRGTDGTWHVDGIAQDADGQPPHERSLRHAPAPSLLGPWAPQADAHEADPGRNPFFVGAPHVLETAPGRWTLFFCDGQREPESNLDCMRRADSRDLRRWTRVGRTLASARRPSGGCDAFLMREGDRWLRYAVAVTADRHGQIVVSARRGDRPGPRAFLHHLRGMDGQPRRAQPRPLPRAPAVGAGALNRRPSAARRACPIAFARRSAP